MKTIILILGVFIMCATANATEYRIVSASKNDVTIWRIELKVPYSGAGYGWKVGEWMPINKNGYADNGGIFYSVEEARQALREIKGRTYRAKQWVLGDEADRNHLWKVVE